MHLDYHETLTYINYTSRFIYSRDIKYDDKSTLDSSILNYRCLTQQVPVREPQLSLCTLVLHFQQNNKTKETNHI